MDHRATMLAVLLLAATSSCVTGLTLAPVGAPAVADLPKADLTFVLTADTAIFKSPTLLKLVNVSKAVTYLSAGNKRVGVHPTWAFTDSSPKSPYLSSDGYWLDQPQAVLYGGDSAGNLSSIAINLQSVKYYSETRILKFNVTLVDGMKLGGGPVESAISDSRLGVGPKLSTALPAANTTWTSMSLVIDSSRLALKQPADTKFWLPPPPPPPPPPPGFGYDYGYYGGGPWWG